VIKAQTNARPWGIDESVRRPSINARKNPNCRSTDTRPQKPAPCDLKAKLLLVKVAEQPVRRSEADSRKLHSEHQSILIAANAPSLLSIVRQAQVGFAPGDDLGDPSHEGFWLGSFS